MKKNKEGNVKGEVTVLSYKKGEALPGFTPIDEGTYSFTLKNAGKPFPKGWKVKPGKFPNKRVVWEALDTEDEKGGNKTTGETISLSPGALPIGPIRLAYAAQHDLTLKQGPKNKPNHPSVRENAQAIDEMLQSIKKEELTLRGDVTHEDWNGQKMARIRWLPPEEVDEDKADEDEEVDEESDEEETDEDESDDEGDEDEAPAKKKGKSQSDDDDDDEDDSEDDADDDDEDDSDVESDGDEDDDAEEDDSDDDEDSEDEDGADEDEDLSDEAVAEHKKKVKPGKKVKQGPSKGKPAAKKSASKKKGKK